MSGPRISKSVGGSSGLGGYSWVWKDPPHPCWSVGNRKGRRGRPFYVLNKSPNVKIQNVPWQGFPLIAKKIQLGILNDFKWFLACLCYRKQGRVIQTCCQYREKARTMPAILQLSGWNPGEAAFLTMLTHRHQPTSRAGVKPNKPEGYRSRRRVLK